MTTTEAPVYAWRTVPCPSCRELVIAAIDTHGQALKVDPQPCAAGDLALTDKGPGFPPVAYKPKPHLGWGRKLRRQHAANCVPPNPLLPPAKHRPGSTPVLGPHTFVPLPATYDRDLDNEDYPPDPYTGRLTCATCKALGEPGDQRHPIDLTPPALPVLPASLAAAGAARDAAVLGEKPEDPE